jgi:hypothetical protein
MGYRQVSGLTTIAGNKRSYWELKLNEHGEDIGPCFLQAQLIWSYDNLNRQLQSNNQGIILRYELQSSSGGYMDIAQYYTVEIWNSDADSAQYWLRAGTFG